MLCRSDAVVFLAGFLAEILEYAYSGEDRHTESVGHDPWIDEAETAGKEDDPFNPPCRDQELADHSGADADHADKGGHRGKRHIDKGGINAKHSRIHNEHIRNDKSGDAQFRRVHAGTERIAAGNGCACESCQRYRRGNVGDDAEVEYKHMRCQNRHAQRNQGWRSDGRSNDIVRCGRNAHAEKKGGDHRAEEEQDEGTRGNINEGGSEFQSYAGLGDDADDDARCSAGDEHAQRASGAFDESVNDIREGHARIGAEHGSSDGNHNACQCRFHRGIAGRKEADDGNQRDRQVPFFLHDLPYRRQEMAGRSFQVLPFRFKMNAQEYADEVENGRHNSSFHHFHVRNAYEFRHKEGSGAHDRRHELAPGGGGCFYGAGKVLAVAELFHHRNGECAGPYHVGHGAAGNGAFQRTGEDRYLRRTAGSPAGDGIGNINEEFPEACLFEVRPEENEEENEGRRHAEGNAEDAFCSKEEMSYHLRQSESSVRERSRQVRSKEAVRDKAENDDHDRKAYNTPCCFNDHNNAKGADHLISRRYRARAENELLVIQQNIHRRDHGHNGKEQIEGMDIPALHPGPLGRAEQVDQRNAEGQMDRTLDHGVHQTEEPCIDLEQREADADHCDPLRPDTAVLDRIGFFIQFLQLFFQFLVHHTSFHLVRSGRSVFLCIIQ